MNKFYQTLEKINNDIKSKNVFQKVCRTLLEGKTIAYRDNYPMSIDNPINLEIPHYNKEYSDFLYENFDFLKEFFYILNFTLQRYEYPVSNLEKYRWSYVLNWTEEQINPVNKINLSRSKLLICGIVYVATNTGLKFILLRDLLSVLTDRPNEVFLTNVNFEMIFRIIHPSALTHTKTTSTVEIFKNRFVDEIQSLVDLDYILLVKNNGMGYVTVGPSTYHLQTLLTDILRRKENEAR